MSEFRPFRAEARPIEGKALGRRLPQALRRFLRDESGAAFAMEVILFSTLMAFTAMMLFAFWEAYRVRATAGNATYVIADMISREGAPINEAYVTGMGRVFSYIANNGNDRAYIRVTSLDFHAGTNRYRVLWSRSTDNTRAPRLTTADLAPMRNVSLPNLEDGAALLLIESWRDFMPAFKVGLEPRTFYSRQFMLPRFLSPLPLS